MPARTFKNHTCKGAVTPDPADFPGALSAPPTAPHPPLPPTSAPPGATRPLPSPVQISETEGRQLI
jgi:hypothetical protein